MKGKTSANKRPLYTVVDKGTRGSKKRPDQIEANLHHLARLIHENRLVVFITGAGLSVASGIPTFRGEDNSVWSKHTVSTATTKSFHKNPLAWYNDFWLESFPHKFTRYPPNPGHEAIAWLAHHYKNVKVITQNIDSLHQQTRQPWAHADSLVEVHGRMGLYRCMAASKGAPELPQDKRRAAKTCPYRKDKWIDPSAFPEAQRAVLEPPIQQGNDGPAAYQGVPAGKGGGRSPAKPAKLRSIPRCPGCGGPAAPLALLFDEAYSSHEFYQYDKARRGEESSPSPCPRRSRRGTRWREVMGDRKKL